MLPEPDRHRPIQSFLDHHPSASFARMHWRQQLIEPLPEPHHVVVAHHPLGLDRQDRLQPVLAAQRSVAVPGTPSRIRIALEADVATDNPRLGHSGRTPTADVRRRWRQLMRLTVLLFKRLQSKLRAPRVACTRNVGIPLRRGSRVDQGVSLNTLAIRCFLNSITDVRTVAEMKRRETYPRPY